MIRAVLLTLGTAACGRVGFEPLGGEAFDARPDVPANYCATATFDNPAASSFVEDFTTSAWAVGVSGCASISPGELVATPASNSAQYCFLESQLDLHLTCNSLTVRVPEVTAPLLRVQTFIYVTSGATPLYLILEGTGLQMGQPGDIDSFASSDFNHSRDAWWRIREFEGATFFDTAPDGVAWVQRMQIPTPFSFDHVKLTLGAGTYEAVANPGRARFRCFNQPPPCS